MGRILFRYVCREIAAPFAVGLLIFTVVLFTTRILKLVELVVNRGVPFWELLKIFLYILPAFFEVTVPMAFLLALLWGLGRLLADQEMTALKSCGISLYQVAVPVWTLTTLVLCGTLVLTLHVRPWSHTALKHALYDITKVRASAGLKEKTFNTDFEGLVIYAEEIQPPGSILRGVMIADSRERRRKNTIFASQGVVVTNESHHLLTLRLLDGTIHSVEPPEQTYQTTHFSIYDVTLNLATALAETKELTRSPQEMPLDELRETIFHNQIAPADRRKALVELHRRFALPFACVVFSLLALSLGTQSTWIVRSHGFAISLAIIFTYYLLLTVGEALGEKGLLPPVIALWIPNVILGAGGLYLFQKATQERPFGGFSSWKRSSLLKQAVCLWTSHSYKSL